MNAHDNCPKNQWLDAEVLKAIAVTQVLDHYALADRMTQRGPSANGPSPFNEGGILSVNTQKNVWNDSRGRPQVEGKIVPGNVIGLVQAIEGVGFRRALELMAQHFGPSTPPAGIELTRSDTATALRHEAVEAKREGNTPFGKELKGLKADVPFLREAGISPSMAKAWGVGWCSRGLLRGRVAFPIRSAEGTVMAYTGLSPKDEAPEGRWRFPSGFQRSLELFGVDRIFGDEALAQVAREQGLTLAADPLKVLVTVRDQVRAVVSPMGLELSPAQLRVLLDPRINPTARVTLLGDEAHRRSWASALVRQAWIRYQDPSDGPTPNPTA